MTRGGGRLLPLALPGPAGPLEAVLREPEGGAHDLIAVVCHPHPLYGGTLNNKVVHRTAATLHELGAAVLRFNFRGVGRSAGRHDQGAGELDDARAAMEYLRARHPRARSWIAGFSFGALIAARLAAADRGIGQLIMIAPPVQDSDFRPLRTARVPKLVVQGTADELCPPAAVETQFQTWSEPKRLVWIEGASHFFDKRLGALSQALVEALAAAAKGGASCST